MIRHCLLAAALVLLPAACGEENKEGAAYREASGNMVAAREFLAEMAARDGVSARKSGLLYEVLRAAEGGGLRPAAKAEVTVHYEGTLADGQVFDSSYDRGTPATFPLNRVIAGWTEGLQLMAVGEKYRFYIPPQLAYGARGRPPVIPENAALVFDVELLAIDGEGVAGS